MKRGAALVLLLLTGCSTAPVAGLLDWLAPGQLPPEKTTPHGGVCLPQGILAPPPAPAAPVAAPVPGAAPVAPVPWPPPSPAAVPVGPVGPPPGAPPPPSSGLP
jgi:hypothetical protein